MPVVYGEGEAEAFIRLCKEVIQRYDRYKGRFIRHRLLYGTLGHRDH